MGNIPVYIPSARDRVIARLQTRAGHREWQVCLEDAGLDWRMAWPRYIARVCPELPSVRIGDVVAAVRRAIMARHGLRAAA